MGAGGDARPVRLVKRIKSSDKLRKIEGVKNDLIVLKSIWLNKASGQDHASRLEAFYGPQAHACECALLRILSTPHEVDRRHVVDITHALQTTVSGAAFYGAASPC